MHVSWLTTGIWTIISVSVGSSLSSKPQPTTCFINLHCLFLSFILNPNNDLIGRQQPVFVKTYTINTRLLGEIAVTERNRTKEVEINFLKGVFGKKHIDEKYNVVTWYNMESFDNIYKNKIIRIICMWKTYVTQYFLYFSLLDCA